MSMLLKNRARLVCVQCHGRKIKCDLEESLDNTCAYCRRHKVSCIRREGVRKRSLPHELQASNRSRSSSPLVHLRPDISNALSEADPKRLGDKTLNSAAYIAQHSVLQDAEYNDESGRCPSTALPATELTGGGVTTEVKIKILKATDAHKLPKPPLRRALFDAFFANLSYAFPMIDRGEVESPHASVLLQQAVCMAGSLMRHPNLPDSLPRTTSLYEKVKILLCLNFESNMLAVLKVLCLLILWSPCPSHVVSLDGPWHATGTAMRLAVQMGMHKDSTYATQSDRGCRRRLWWLLHSSDSIQALIYGRPHVLRAEDCDVQPISEDDFDLVDFQARHFIADTRMAAIMGELASKISQNASSVLDKAQISQWLATWIAQLHPELRLYDPSGYRTTYHFPVSELHIEYLGTVILSQAMSRQFAKQWPYSTACLIASACMASLYEEIVYREQIALLTTMHAFWCLTAAIPLIYYKPETELMEAQRQESLGILCSVVEQLQPRFGVSRTVANKIQRLQRERRDIISQQAADYDRTQTQGNNTRQDEGACQLNAFFPQLRAWSTCRDAVLHNPILDGVAQTHAMQETQGTEPLVQWIFDGPLSVFDTLGASSFMETMLTDNFNEDEMGFDLSSLV